MLWLYFQPRRQDKTKVALSDPQRGDFIPAGASNFFRLGLVRIGDGYRKLSLTPTSVPEESRRLSFKKPLVFPPVCIPTWPFTPEVRTGTTHQGLRCMNRRHTTPRQDHVGPPSTDHRVQTFNSVVPIAPRAVPSRFPANQILREQSPWQLSLAFRTESHQHTVW